MITIYLAGPLFSLAEQRFNLELASLLGKEGYTVILPQIEAEAFKKNGGYNMQAISDDCVSQALSADIVVAILDGPDADSGTSVEVGIRVGSKKPVIGVRTDFRGSEDEETGVNAMFRSLDGLVIYKGDSLEILAQKIFASIQKVLTPATK